LPYIGNTPAEKYAAFNVQNFTTSATTSYTLDRAVANELDIRLVINNVIQQPGVGKAYTASGTTLTLSGATSGTDTMYAVYIGKAVQTVNPGAGSVGTTALADNAVTNAKLADATQGDVIYYGAAGAPAQLSAGTNGHFLKTQGAGANPVWAAVAAGVSLTGSTNNTVATVTGANALAGEANLTFDGTDLTVATGNVVIGTSGKGIDFSATSGTGTSEVLDDYEYGTFTPSMASTIGSFTTVGTCSGYYTKVGKMVQVQMELSLTTVGSGSGNIDVTNMPFTSAATGIVHTLMMCRETQTAGVVYDVIMSRDVTACVILAPSMSNGSGYSINGMYRVA